MRQLCCIALAAFLGCTFPMPSARAAERQTVHRFERSLAKSAGYTYLLALPEGYAPRTERKWPLILFLHGAGERGDDVWMVARHGPPKLLRNYGAAKETAKPGGPAGLAAKFLAENFIVVSPQCPKGGWWDTEALLALLDEMGASHAVDSTRVYLTGLSMGGFGTWDLGAAHPERFAAIAPVCGGGQLIPLVLAPPEKLAALRSLGVWAFHGAKDQTVPVSESERMMGLLRRMRVTDIEFTVYPEAKHDSWTLTYANPELYAWFLRHRRGKPAR